MKVHYPKLYNMANLLSLNVFTASKGSNNYILFIMLRKRFMDSVKHDNRADVIEAFNSTSRYLDDLLNIDNPYFEGMVKQINPPELQLNKANTTDTETPF